ncbi:hypothetical protein [Salirhabdus salicampi]|uniref:hypothetical protein n=1 Tax=Salirhabdus salicampi TaxID=476102 RepID=UPI0020C2FF48|nr:hypothetical protein [Salirhabdus salicampi]MCP8615580.1 hypothetical protein [Salirhabdus salicampi]
MAQFFLQLAVFGTVVIILTAFLPIILQGIGEHLIGRKERHQFSSRSKSIQDNWKSVGGK